MKATDLITVTRLGKDFKACRHCVGHLDRTIARFTARFPGARFYIAQGPWNIGVAASAGTHDKCSAFDVVVTGVSWLDAQGFFRVQGWAAWYRPTLPGVWNAHIHMLSIGCEQSKGIYVPGQLADHAAHKTGMKGHLPDPTWFPAASEVSRYVWVEPTPPALPPRIVKAIDSLRRLKENAKNSRHDRRQIKQSIDALRQTKKR